MRILLLADAHANGEALLALQRAEPQPDAVLFAGDAVGYGPDPVNCARWLAANATAAVRGNHDEALLTGVCAGEPTELEAAAVETLAYARRMFTPADLARLQKWPLTTTLELGGARFFLAHGSPMDPLGGNLEVATCRETVLRALCAELSADVIVLGHTHRPALRRLDDRLFVNPGSLGQPRYGVPDATYAVWEDGRVQIKHLHYHPAATVRRLALLPLSPEVQEQLTGILETGLM